MGLSFGCYETGVVYGPLRQAVRLYAAILRADDATGSPIIRERSRDSSMNFARSAGSSALSRSPRLGMQCFSTHAWPKRLNSAGSLTIVRRIRFIPIGTVKR